MKKLIMTSILLGALFLPLYSQTKPRDWDPSPRTLTALQNAGRVAGLPIGLAECVAYGESRFKYWVVGHTGDMGLMQINPQYEEYLADRFFPGGYKAFRWWVIEDNATLGCNYLAYLIDHFGGSIYLGIVSYCWGMTNVINITEWEDIPKTVRTHVNSVLNNLDFYY